MFLPGTAQSWEINKTSSRRLSIATSRQYRHGQYSPPRHPFPALRVNERVTLMAREETSTRGHCVKDERVYGAHERESGSSVSHISRECLFNGTCLSPSISLSLPPYLSLSLPSLPLQSPFSRICRGIRRVRSPKTVQPQGASLTSGTRAPGSPTIPSSCGRPFRPLRERVRARAAVTGSCGLA